MKNTYNTTPAEKDLFAKFDSKLSTWTPPEGQFSAVDHYIDRCRRFVNTLDFKRSLTCRFPNLSQAERLALRNLRRRTDVVKPDAKRARNIFMPKNINSITIIITLEGIEKIKTEKK